MSTVALVILAASAVGFALFAWFAPRTFVGVALLVIAISPTLSSLLPDAGTTYLDELVIVVAVVVLFARRLLRRRGAVFARWMLWFGGFFVFGVVSALVHSVPLVIMAEGAFLAVKGIAFGIAAAQVDWRVRDLRPLIFGGATTVVVIFVACVVDAFNPDWWSGLILGAPRYFTGVPGLQALLGPFVDPAALGRLSALFVIAIVAYMLLVRAGLIPGILLGMATFSALASFRVKTFVSVAGALLVTGWIARRRIPRWVFITAAGVAVLAAVPLYLFVAQDFSNYVLNPSARSAMTFGSVRVASEYFPFGAGFGRFGSFIAGDHYSPEYVRLGFESIQGLGSRPGDGNFLTDTQWPAILGEAGWIGGALFAAGLVHLIVTVVRTTTAGHEPLVAWLRLTTIGWIAVVVIESVAAPVFTSAPAYPFPFVAAGILLAISRGWSRSGAVGAQDRVDAED